MVFVAYLLCYPLRFCSEVRVEIAEFKKMTAALVWLADEANELPENFIDFIQGRR